MELDFNFLKCGIAGGLAGLSVDAFFYPLQTIKTRVMGSSLKENLVENTVGISKFKGFSCQLIISFPYSFTFFLVYQGIRDRLPNSHSTNFLAAVVAECFSNVIKNPLQLVKQQMMVGRADRIGSSLREVYSTFGVRGFYIGYTPALVRDVLFSALQLPLYEHLKSPVAQFTNRAQNSPLVSAVSGAVAAAVSAILTCPLDVIKTRHQTMKLHDAWQQRVTSIDIARVIYNEQSWKGFFRGVWLRTGLMVTGGVIYFSALASWKNLLKVKN